jgi:hypothetical protein
MLSKQLLVEERKLHGVCDLLYLEVEATYFGVAHVGDFFEEKVIHFGTGKKFEKEI